MKALRIKAIDMETIMKNIIINSLILACLFPIGAFAGNQKPTGGFGAGVAAFNASLENYLTLSSATEAGVFRAVSEASPKNSTRREVLLALFVRYLGEEQRSLATLRKDVEGILNLAESEMPGPDKALAEMVRVQAYLDGKGLIRWGKVKAFETALVMPAAKFEDISKLGNLLYSVNPTQDSAADVYAAVMSARDTLSNSLRELERSVLLAELAAAGGALRDPESARKPRANTSRQERKRVLASEVRESPGDIVYP